MQRTERTRSRQRWAIVIAALLMGAAMVSAQAAVAQANAIQNGEFSQGLNGWTSTIVAPGIYSGYPHLRVITQAKCEPAQAGNPFLEIDVPGGANGYVQQQISVPQAPGPLTFRTWGNLEAVQVSIGVVTLSDHVVHSLLAYTPPTLQASPGTCSGRKPITQSLDVTAFAGQTVDLRVEATASGFDGTIADFDNFALQGTQQQGPKLCLVPKLRGSSLVAAENALKHANCVAGKVTKRASATVPKGKVISSSPTAGSKRNAGTKVALTVSRGKH